MFTWSSPRKKAKDASSPACFPAIRHVAGRYLVLVVAATHRQLALRAARLIERAVRHVTFFRNAICKSIVYGIISDARIETKRKSI